MKIDITIPGMTPTSLLPQIAAGSGYDFPGLCEAILLRAMLDAPGTHIEESETATASATEEAHPAE